MKERPIMFSPESVVGILAECKTQTRRVMVQPDSYSLGYIMSYDKKYAIQCGPDYPDDESDHRYCPHGVPGDRLWVREPWAYFGGDEDLYQKNTTAVAYKATWAADQCEWPPFARHIGYIPGGRWRHAMFMPRWASRITMEITDIRVERVQEISEADAICEGCRADEDPYWRPTYSDPDSGGNPSARRSYEYLWDTINGKRNRGEYAWVKNPWVWVIDFRRLDDVHKAR